MNNVDFNVFTDPDKSEHRSQTVDLVGGERAQLTHWTLDVRSILGLPVHDQFWTSIGRPTVTQPGHLFGHCGEVQEMYMVNKCNIF